MATNDPEEVLAFWIGPLDADGLAAPGKQESWFSKDPAFDALCRERFEPLLAAIARGERDGWLATPRGRLAAIVVLDQLTRNMFRDTPKMYAHDALAWRLAEEGIARGDDRALGFQERTFLYMPLMHAEDVDAQRRCTELFLALRDAATPRAREFAEKGARYAELHRDIVVRFGRFPHRNRILGRASTPEEEAFLTEPNSSF